jgi:hypothetical protein
VYRILRTSSSDPDRNLMTNLSPTFAVARVFRLMLCSDRTAIASNRFLLDPVKDVSNNTPP